MTPFAARKPVTGLEFVVTGRCSRSREAMHADILLAGGTYSLVVRARTDYLVTGEAVGATKLRDAKRCQTKIISEAAFDVMRAGLPERREASPREFARNFVAEPAPMPNADLVGRLFWLPDSREWRTVMQVDGGGIVDADGERWSVSFVKKNLMAVETVPTMAAGPMQWDREPGQWGARPTNPNNKCDRCGYFAPTDERMCANCRRDLRRQASENLSRPTRDDRAMGPPRPSPPPAPAVDLEWRPGRRKFGR